jgi:glycosyltransferase involved in cell wall biosynthesis
MHILCLMPTYGRKASLLSNAIACFVAQTHPNKSLLIYDDLGTLADTWCSVPNVYIVSTSERAPNLSDKYNIMLRHAAAASCPYEAVAVWDDDDVYLPHHLQAHAQALNVAAWSKPSRIISAFHSPPVEEAADGRFHGSIAVRRDTVSQYPWPDTLRATFDQEYMEELLRVSLPHDTLKTMANLGRAPSYVYRWQTSQSSHCSGLMDRDTWYADYKPQSILPIQSLGPFMDADTAALYSRYGCGDSVLPKNVSG